MPTRARRPSPDRDPTLLQILQQPNPEMKDRLHGPYNWNRKERLDEALLDEVDFDSGYSSVKLWTDFTFEAIYLAYGHLLDQKMRALVVDYRPVSPPAPGLNVTTIKQEGHIRRLGFAWSVNIVASPIAAAAAQLRPQLAAQPNGETPLTSLLLLEIDWVHRILPTVSFEPDFAILDLNTEVHYREDNANEPKKYFTFAVGHGKLEQRWKSKWLVLAGNDLPLSMDPPFGQTSSNIHSNIEHERILPLREMATFCRYAQTRYAFIMTQTELVALRIRRLPRRPREKAHYAGVEYVSVPWDASTGLTFNLAIWALGCMGMNDAHREMEAPVPVKNTALESMARLTWWKYDAQNKVYENVISKRRIPEHEWQELDTSFVHLDEQSGNSFTSKFVSPDSPRVFGQYTTWAPGGIEPLNLSS